MVDSMHVEQSVRSRYSDAAQEREVALCCPVNYRNELLEAAGLCESSESLEESARVALLAETLNKKLLELAAEEEIQLMSGDREIDDVLTYALFPQIGLKFLKNRNNAAAWLHR